MNKQGAVPRKMGDQGIVTISTPEEFAFAECLAFLNRSTNECLHAIEGDHLYKLIKVGEEKVLMRISLAFTGGEELHIEGQGVDDGREVPIEELEVHDRRDVPIEELEAHDGGNVQIEKQGAYKEGRMYWKESSGNAPLLVKRVNGLMDEQIAAAVQRYLVEWFDLDRDLKPFYHLAAGDPVLQPLVERYYGLRLMGIPDLFEALSWAIIGQQINLTFAYTLKRRLVENYGEAYTHNGKIYWLHPTPERIAVLTVPELTELQLTRRKAEYLIGLATAFASGHLSKELLLSMGDPAKIQETLTALRGIGKWTADYVIMKSFRCPTAFPIGDAGLQNAVRYQLAMPEKPTQAQLIELGQRWSGWEAYATFYLWRSLI